MNGGPRRNILRHIGSCLRPMDIVVTTDRPHRILDHPPIPSFRDEFLFEQAMTTLARYCLVEGRYLTLKGLALWKIRGNKTWGDHLTLKNRRKVRYYLTRQKSIIQTIFETSALLEGLLSEYVGPLQAAVKSGIILQTLSFLRWSIHQNSLFLCGLQERQDNVSESWSVEKQDTMLNGRARER